MCRNFRHVGFCIGFQRLNDRKNQHHFQYVGNSDILKCTLYVKGLIKTKDSSPG